MVSMAACTFVQCNRLLLFPGVLDNILAGVCFYRGRCNVVAINAVAISFLCSVGPGLFLRVSPRPLSPT